MDEKIKHVPAAPKVAEEFGEETLKDYDKIYYISLSLIFLGYLLMIVLITLLSISMVFKIFALLIGSFLIIDIHRSLKAKMFEYGRRNKLS